VEAVVRTLLFHKEGGPTPLQKRRPSGRNYMKEGTQGKRRMGDLLAYWTDVKSEIFRPL